MKPIKIFYKLNINIALGAGHYLSAGGGGGGQGNFLVNPSFLRRPPCQIFISQSTPLPQQQTVCNADPPPVAPPHC